MGRLGRLVAALAALFSVGACDPTGTPYEDVRLAQLKVGQSTEPEIVRLFGAPAAVRTSPEGRGLIYPLGPEGAHTLLLKLGPDGRYQGREDLLTRQNFARVVAGLTREEVSALLGPPGRVQAYALKKQTAWEFRFLDGMETRLFVVMFDSDGRVVGSAIEEDPRRLGG